MRLERSRGMGKLLGAPVWLNPFERESWFIRLSGHGDDARAELDSFVGVEDWDGFARPPEPPGQATNRTVSWHIPGRWRATDRLEPTRRFFGAGSQAESGGFSPKALVAKGLEPQPISKDQVAARARLRELPMILILILAMSTFWRCAIIQYHDLVLNYVDAIVIVALAGVIALLRTSRAILLQWLFALELAVIAVFASRVAIVEYRLILMFSLRDDLMTAQLIMKNIVLLTSTLILADGLYAPRTLGRAALVVGPLAFLPFATLSILILRHPNAMAWLGRGSTNSETPRILLFGFDAMILLILAFASTFGACAIARLHRQVAEAQQLDKYRLRRRLGAGGMGQVYLAEHRLLKRPCALKVIRPGNLTDATAHARFEHEIRLTATLSHPNTVEIYDYGRTGDGAYYYVMEYLPGLSLADLVKRHGHLSPARATYLLRQVCGALQEAHAAGLIHRNIKPSNIFAARRGGMADVAKVLDFGLAGTSPTVGASDLSDEGHVLGAGHFMSPEQARGNRELDARGDIYSLGAVAYYILTGHPPYDTENGIELRIAPGRDPIVAPSVICGGIPEDLENVVLRCLAEDPDDRFPDAESLERALSECACGEDWGQESASRWWRDAGQIVATPASTSAYLTAACFRHGSLPPAVGHG